MRRREVRKANVSRFSGGDGIFEGRAVSYGVVDEYQSMFERGAFTESLRVRKPSICIGHDWTNVVGLVVDWHEDDDGLYIVGKLDDPEFVPDAAKAWHQMRSGSVRELSVGFFRREDKRHPTRSDVTIITKAELDEVSLVLVGSVPRAEVLATRSSRDRRLVSSRAASGRGHRSLPRPPEVGSTAAGRRSHDRPFEEIDDALVDEALALVDNVRRRRR